ncbi:MraY family glycosyltransferase [Allorhodopirellula heiligendammensis]|uniref:WecA-like glycosyltransferase n=1 Tax=Allorhodopirellula heiligendammensis TaxID=2714739 RepID=A0A5C6BVL6_9BACT|nr:MraY family glycosyltransferase [Allorhodopirellula heiligendammensis]TWU15922.1 WecA-like glycosyltransferase [Allorhodopirellula heiligendammensis]
MFPLSLAFFASAFAAVLLVPIVRFIAVRIGLVDRPDAERKLHGQPIALAGGVAVFASLLIGIWVPLGLQMRWQYAIPVNMDAQRWFVLLGALIAILIVGLIDDKWSLRGRQKLLAQCLIAMVVVGSGTSLDEISLLGLSIPLGVFALPFSVLWLLLCINALNLLDGADGMATTVGIFISGALAMISFLHGSLPLITMTAFALCGALVGFLVYNRPPASIFLGDAGSMMVGLLIGVLSMWCQHKETTAFAAAPLAILVLPLFDSVAAILRRWLTGRSLYATDRGHMHHLLNERFGRVGTLWVVAAACLLSSSTAIASVWLKQSWLAPVGALIVLTVFVGTRTFGYSELRLVAGRARHLLISFSLRPAVCEQQKHERVLKLQGDGPWHDVWEPLIDFAVRQNLASVIIDVNMAWLQESYHATWRSVQLPEPAFQSIVRIPLFAAREHSGQSERVPIGRLEIIASSNPDSLNRLSDFLEHAAELQIQVEHVVKQIEEFKRRALAKSPGTPNSVSASQNVMSKVS